VTAEQSSVTYFQKELLPPPSSFYEQELGGLPTIRCVA
jgi:hypothetical protein